MRTLTRFLTVALLVAACKPGIPPREFDGPTAFGYLERQVAFGNRIPGTGPHDAMGDWLDSLLRTRADTVVVQAWTHVTARGDTLRLRNLIARFNPGARQRVLYLAHWDTRPHADAPGSKDKSKPVPGANDGASGVALLLGVADALRKQPPKIGVDLLFDDGEDYGDFTKEPDDVLMGARYFAAHQLSPEPPLYAVLWDIVADKDLQIYQEGNSLLAAPEVVDLVWKTAHDLGYTQHFVAAPKHTLIDDHVELEKVGLRAIDVVDFDYPSWHTPEDTIDKVSAQSLQIVGDVAMAVLRGAEP
jgi:Zn-dependent M28 family amino/carboxypeptidase